MENNIFTVVEDGDNYTSYYFSTLKDALKYMRSSIIKNDHYKAKCYEGKCVFTTDDFDVKAVNKLR